MQTPSKRSINGQINPATNSEVVVINVDVLLNGGWSMMGPAYKAPMWGGHVLEGEGDPGSAPVQQFRLERAPRPPSLSEIIAVGEGALWSN